MSFKNDAKAFRTYDPDRNAELVVQSEDREGGVSFIMKLDGVDYPFYADYIIKSNSDPHKQHIHWKVRPIEIGLTGDVLFQYKNIENSEKDSLKEAILESLKVYGYFYGMNKGTASASF